MAHMQLCMRALCSCSSKIFSGIVVTIENKLGSTNIFFKLIVFFGIRSESHQNYNICSNSKWQTFYYLFTIISKIQINWTYIAISLWMDVYTSKTLLERVCIVVEYCLGDCEINPKVNGDLVRENKLAYSCVMRNASSLEISTANCSIVPAS